MRRESFELDERRTFIGNRKNETWVAYAICPLTKEVVDFFVGRRSKRTLKHITGNLLLSEVKSIKTDRLNIYGSLIPKRSTSSTTAAPTTSNGTTWTCGHN